MKAKGLACGVNSLSVHIPVSEQPSP